MTDYGEIILRQIFAERVESSDLYHQIRTKSKILTSDTEEELFWVWLEYIKNIGSDKEDKKNDK